MALGHLRDERAPRGGGASARGARPTRPVIYEHDPRDKAPSTNEGGLVLWFLSAPRCRRPECLG
jgi:hypothetical protein